MAESVSGINNVCGVTCMQLCSSHRTHSRLIAERPRVREPLPQLRQHSGGQVHRQYVRDARSLQVRDERAHARADVQYPGPWAEARHGMDDPSQPLRSG